MSTVVIHKVNVFTNLSDIFGRRCAPSSLAPASKTLHPADSRTGRSNWPQTCATECSDGMQPMPVGLGLGLIVLVSSAAILLRFDGRLLGISNVLPIAVMAGAPFPFPATSRQPGVLASCVPSPLWRLAAAPALLDALGLPSGFLTSSQPFSLVPPPCSSKPCLSFLALTITLTIRSLRPLTLAYVSSRRPRLIDV